ncbi:MAG: sigma-70 family RNA polymerase sigma factor [Cyclobacteriaceae bacterium]|nr:sigma-70 family RNA polymerase sigma factor [Cyclobacteriaceae bacterium]
MDTELLELFKQGNRQAFEVIYYRYTKHLYRFARKNVRSKEDCEEIVHEVFESLISRKDTLLIDSLKHYLFTSVRYKIIRYFSHREVKRKFAEHYRNFEKEYEEPELILEKAPEKLHASLLDHIQDLPERCREAIRLRITENLSNGEIASRMNINKRTAELYISKAFAHLRASYDKIYKTS